MQRGPRAGKEACRSVGERFIILVKGNITTEVSELHLIAVYCSTEARELQCQRVVIVDGELDGGHGWVDDPYAGETRTTRTWDGSERVSSAAEHVVQTRLC